VRSNSFFLLMTIAIAIIAGLSVSFPSYSTSGRFPFFYPPSPPPPPINREARPFSPFFLPRPSRSHHRPRDPFFFFFPGEIMVGVSPSSCKPRRTAILQSDPLSALLSGRYDRAEADPFPSSFSPIFWKRLRERRSFPFLLGIAV